MSKNKKKSKDKGILDTIIYPIIDTSNSIGTPTLNNTPIGVLPILPLSLTDDNEDEEEKKKR